MTILRSGGRTTARRVAVVDAYEFPAGVRIRFTSARAALSTDDVRIVEAGVRQWFRLFARHPRAQLAMPSTVVDDLWREFARHTHDYAALGEYAFARMPESTSGPTALALTYRLAREDELDAGRLPLLFRVDADLRIEGGRHYLADCGGRGRCHDLPGAVCLQHLAGSGRGLHLDWDRDRARSDSSQEGGGLDGEW